MVEVFSQALQETITIERVIGKINGKKDGPTIVFFAGMHGNETAGVFALKRVLSQINSNKTNGTIYGVSGNLKALELNERFVTEDLNRIWTPSYLNKQKTKTPLINEENECLEIFTLLKEILKENTGPFYFIDLHTTSSKTIPFITINDALINRSFSKLFPVPIVLGIEEYLEGPLLSYINQLGYVSLGFESGQHNEESSISNAVAFIYLSLVYSDIMNKDDIVGLPIYYRQLQVESKNTTSIFEVIFRHNIREGEQFKMKEGFESFQKIKKHTLLAWSNNNPISSNYSAQLFMPLYQTRGDDGFYIIKIIKPFFLRLSFFLRKLKVDNLLIILPGISWDDPNKEVLKINLKVARFLAKPFFHLLGYRSRQIDSTHLRLFNRERVAKAKMYNHMWWYKKTT